MMRAGRKSAGFTLMELVCAMAIASIIALAATSVLLLGTRINRSSVDTVTQQSTTRILVSVFEDLTADGTIAQVHAEHDSWTIRGKEGRPLLSYQDGIIFNGAGTTIMEDILSSNVELDENLLTFMVETSDGVYESSIYCRSVVSASGSSGDEDATVTDTPTFEGVSEARKKFLDVLASQNGSDGRIMVYVDVTDTYEYTGTYYSEWYIGDYADHPAWNKDTPWCACFVSWAIDQCKDSIEYDNDNDILTDDLPIFANVDRFMDDFILRGTYIDAEEMDDKNYTPEPGDIIFFDWKVNDVEDPEHVGVVAAVDMGQPNNDADDYIYTIEGNNGGKVVICRYEIDNPEILGYGQLQWKTETNP